MKKLTTSAGTFGPYETIETLSDRYRCDGAELPFSVVGEGGAVSDVQPGDFPPVVPPFDRQASAVRIDEAVAAIYARPYRFVTEYTEREAQAQQYVDAGYTGAVPPRVAEFCEPAGLPAQVAADLILSQAANLRAAKSELSALRMRKYAVLNATSDAEAAQIAGEIIAAIAAIGAQVS